MALDLQPDMSSILTLRAAFWRVNPKWFGFCFCPSDSSRVGRKIPRFPSPSVSSFWLPTVGRRYCPMLGVYFPSFEPFCPMINPPQRILLCHFSSLVWSWTAPSPAFSGLSCILSSTYSLCVEILLAYSISSLQRPSFPHLLLPYPVRRRIYGPSTHFTPRDHGTYPSHTIYDILPHYNPLAL